MRRSVSPPTARLVKPGAAGPPVCRPVRHFRHESPLLPARNRAFRLRPSSPRRIHSHAIALFRGQGLWCFDAGRPGFRPSGLRSPILRSPAASIASFDLWEKARKRLRSPARICGSGLIYLPHRKVRGWSAERRFVIRAPREGARRAVRSARSPPGAPLVASCSYPGTVLPGPDRGAVPRPDPGSGLCCPSSGPRPATEGSPHLKRWARTVDRDDPGALLTLSKGSRAPHPAPPTKRP